MGAPVSGLIINYVVGSKEIAAVLTVATAVLGKDENYYHLCNNYWRRNFPSNVMTSLAIEHLCIEPVCITLDTNGFGNVI